VQNVQDDLPRARGVVTMVRTPVAVHQAGQVLRIGRHKDNDIVLQDLRISRFHAEMRRAGDTYEIVDLGSTNGVHLNGVAVGRARLTPGDRIAIGRHDFVFDGGHLHQFVDTGPASLFADDLSVQIGKTMLLDDVSFAVREGSLVGVIGPSGCGKSTLIKAVTGLRPADQGRVQYDGRDLYQEYAELRYRIGMVPQDDVLHRQLTVRRALRFAASLRFADDVPRRERAARVDQVIGMLGLAERANQRIDTLSGGQRKRTSVALELLTEPSLLCLDEPTSGLDPALDREVMRELRRLADSGRTVMVVTHSVLHLSMCDRVLVMCLGGRMGYFGPPDQVLDFFGANDYADVFEMITNDAPTWAARYRNSDVYREHVGDVVLQLTSGGAVQVPRQQPGAPAGYPPGTAPAPSGIAPKATASGVVLNVAAAIRPPAAPDPFHSTAAADGPSHVTAHAKVIPPDQATAKIVPPGQPADPQEQATAKVGEPDQTGGYPATSKIGHPAPAAAAAAYPATSKVTRSTSGPTAAPMMPPGSMPGRPAAPAGYLGPPAATPGYQPMVVPQQAPPPVAPRAHQRHSPVAPVRQLFTLSGRMVAVILSDRGYALFLLGLPLALALLSHSVPGKLGLGPDRGYSLEAQRILVVLVVGASFIGIAVAIREIVGEAPIYARERAVGVSAGAYLGSKLLVFFVIDVLQVSLFTWLSLLGRPGAKNPLIFTHAGLLEIIVPVALVAFVSTILGLMVSALARSVEQTTPVLVVAVMAELVLSGGLFVLSGQPVLDQISWLSPTRWGFSAGASTVDLLHTLPPLISDPLWVHTASAWWRSIGWLVLQAVVLAVLARLALRRREPGKRD
jgi:ABC-type multidrug transport system ATPase subunit